MIIDFFLQLLTDLVTWVQDLIPEWGWYTTPDDIMFFHNPDGTVSYGSGTFLVQMCNWIRNFNNIFPIDTAVFLMELSMGLFLLFAGHRTAKWVLGMVRGAGTT